MFYQFLLQLLHWKNAVVDSLNFSQLEVMLKTKVGIDKINLDILKTLNLYHKDGYYNIAGELLADANDITFSGIDLVKFGKDLNKILYRETISQTSLLSQYGRSIELFEQYYQYEKIIGYNRVKIELIPKEAFREALANAIFHRTWDTNRYIQIAMYENRIEINSPGGLPKGISVEEYLHGNISVLRNPIIAGIFFRLNLIEQFGTGIARINDEYLHSISKPHFEITENNIKIILPIAEIGRLDLSKDEVAIYNLLKEDVELSRKELDAKSGFDKSKTLRIINNLLDRNVIQKLGRGPVVTYKLK